MNFPGPPAEIHTCGSKNRVIRNNGVENIIKILLSINKRKVELRIIYRCDKFKKKILKVLNIPSQAVEV